MSSIIATRSAAMATGRSSGLHRWTRPYLHILELEEQRKESSRRWMHFFITSLELLNLQRKREGNALRVSSITKAVDKVKAELSRNPAMPQLNLEKDWLKTDEKMFSAK